MLHVLAAKFPNHLICSRCLKHVVRSIRRTKSTSQWTASSVRSTFLDFFCNKYNHLYVPASSVIPRKDEGTYFTNAGMNQFKPIFLGTADPAGPLASYSKVANSQKCIRVGGKHNDLDDVGKDFTHHTFFEMLGNWSFGYYFKTEACQMALELLTEVYRLPKDRLYFTYFGGNEQLGMLADLETRDIWRSLGIPDERVIPFGMRDNFWDMGQTGPCGPCTEIHYDHVGNRFAAHLVNADSPEVVEIWNLVFMQFNRNHDQSLTALPKKHVDTGMGLERISAVLQNSMSNYDTDLFTPIFNAIHKRTNDNPYMGKVGAEDSDGYDMAYRIVADHIRMMTVCIADGLNPGRSDQSHRLRTVMTRCIQSAQILGMPSGSLSELVDIVEMSLGDAFPEIKLKSRKVKDVINQTEEWFQKTFALSQKAFNKFLKKRNSTGIIQGEEAFHLFEGRYGAAIPEEILITLAERSGLTLDLNSFQKILNSKQSTQAQDIRVAERTTLSHVMINKLESLNIPYSNDSYKHNYHIQNNELEFKSGQDSNLVGIIKQDELVDAVKESDECIILLDKTHFYAEGGGQSADTGVLKSQNGLFKVTDVQKSQNYVIHKGHVVEGSFQKGDILQQEIDKEHRLGCMKNHTAAHLLNASLRKYLLDVVQMGSVIKHNKFSFDFSCQVSVGEDVITQIDRDVKEMIQKQSDVERTLMSFKDAMKIDHLVTIPNESYPSEVSVLHIKDGSDNFSTELCCGTHVHNTKDIEGFCIINLSGVAQGTKRVICVTGSEAIQAQEKGQVITDCYKALEEDIKCNRHHITWRERIKHIQRMISDDLLPKTVRDQVKYSLEQIGSIVSTKLNQIKVKSLNEELSMALKNCKEEAIKIHRLEDRKPQLVQKAMYSIEIDKPIILLVENDQSLSAIICVPETEFSNLPDKLKVLIKDRDGVLSKPKTQNNKLFYTVTFKRADPNVSYHEELKQLFQ